MGERVKFITDVEPCIECFCRVSESVFHVILSSLLIYTDAICVLSNAPHYF